MSASNISRVVKSLIKDELVDVQLGYDKREKSLYLTKKGEATLTRIDSFSHAKIKGAFEFLNEKDMEEIIDAIHTYAAALETSRLLREQVKISTLSTSRPLRKKIIAMIEGIQKNEFSLTIPDDLNRCVLEAEKSFYYHNSYNFWYATDKEGKILGSIGLKKINATQGEIKKFFVIPSYRGKEVAQKLMGVLLKAAQKHGLHSLYLGTSARFKRAQAFYEKMGFVRIHRSDLPGVFDVCSTDSVFFQGHMKKTSAVEP